LETKQVTQQLKDAVAACLQAIKTQDDFDYVLIEVLNQSQTTSGFGKDVVIGRVDFDTLANAGASRQE